MVPAPVLFKHLKRVKLISPLRGLHQICGLPNISGVPNFLGFNMNFCKHWNMYILPKLGSLKLFLKLPDGHKNRALYENKFINIIEVTTMLQEHYAKTHSFRPIDITYGAPWGNFIASTPWIDFKNCEPINPEIKLRKDKSIQHTITFPLSAIKGLALFSKNEWEAVSQHVEEVQERAEANWFKTDFTGSVDTRKLKK